MIRARARVERCASDARAMRGKGRRMGRCAMRLGFAVQRSIRARGRDRARARAMRSGDSHTHAEILMVWFCFFSRAQSEEEALVGVPRKKNPYKKFSYRGVDLEGLLEMKNDKLVTLFNARIRRRCVFVM